MDVLQPNLDAMTEESMGHIATVAEIDTVKARSKETWMAGDYDRFSRYMALQEHLAVNLRLAITENYSKS
jgi:hypothetical protein